MPTPLGAPTLVPPPSAHLTGSMADSRLEAVALEAPGVPSDGDAAPRLTLPWLIGLRWAALAAQAALVGISVWYNWLLAVNAALALLATGVLSNIVLLVVSRVSTRTDPKTLLGSALLVDVLLLSATLTVTGGPSNPFSVVYLVYVTLAAVALGAGWTWVVVGAAAGGYASLFAWHVPLSEHIAHTSGLPSHLAGMWLAFAVTAAVIAFFVTGLTRTLTHRERQLAEMRQVAAKHERLASLTTLAAGAAHELATPLASIAVAARELERLADRSENPDLREDAQLIRSQVERCKGILDQMSGRASADWVESLRSIECTDVLTRVRDGLTPERQARCHIEPSPGACVVAPRGGLVQALLNLVRNGFDASPDGGHVSIAVESSADRVRFVVRDTGAGMPPDVLARASEPFFSTKAPGAGFGLGLFLVRIFAERHNGHLELDSTPGAGTTAVLEFPRSSCGQA